MHNITCKNWHSQSAASALSSRPPPTHHPPIQNDIYYHYADQFSLSISGKVLIDGLKFKDIFIMLYLTEIIILSAIKIKNKPFNAWESQKVTRTWNKSAAIVLLRMTFSYHRLMKIYFKGNLIHVMTDSLKNDKKHCNPTTLVFTEHEIIKMIKNEKKKFTLVKNYILTNLQVKQLQLTQNAL